MNIFGMDSDDIEVKVGAMQQLTVSRITWVEFEAFMGVDIRPPKCDKSSNEWKGYVQNRNVLRNMVNGAAMDMGKTKAFQLRPYFNPASGEYELRKLAGKELFEDWLSQQKVRVLNAPKNFVAVMQDMSTKFSLPQKTRNKAINYATVGNMLAGVTKKMIEEVLEDPEMAIPDYSREELLRLTINSADAELMAKEG